MLQLKTWIALLLLGSSLSFSTTLRAASRQSHPSDIRQYRDSLLHRISVRGAVEMSCYLAYPIGSSALDASFGNNPEELSVLRTFLNFSLGDSLLIVREVSLTGYCSPDGPARLNNRLSRQRVLRFYDYLQATDRYFRSYKTNVYSRGADWAGLRRMIADSGYSWSAEALRIIDGDEPPEKKKRLLSALSSGRAHQQIYDMYPFLRRVEVKVTYDVQAMRAQGTLPPENEKKEPELPPSYVSPEVPTYCDTLIYLIESPASSAKLYSRGETDAAIAHPLFALKTNLLFDAALAPNLEVEVPIGKRWSVLAEYTFPWWLRKGDKWCFEMLQAGLEGRYWLEDRERLYNGQQRNLLTGWFVGVYAGGGYYDFQFNRNSGYQGEFYIAAGVSGGYACRLSRRLNLEFSLGLGGLSTKYRKYEVVRGTQQTELMRQDYGRFFWVGPTKAKISLVWLLGNKKGGHK